MHLLIFSQMPTGNVTPDMVAEALTRAAATAALKGRWGRPRAGFLVRWCGGACDASHRKRAGGDRDRKHSAGSVGMELDPERDLHLEEQLSRDAELAWVMSAVLFKVGVACNCSINAS